MKPPLIHPFLAGFLADHSASQEAPSQGDGLEWDSIICEAITQGVGTMFHLRLRNSGLHRQVPSALLDHLKTYAFSLATRNLAASQELTAILRGFQAGGVACIPIRGLALSEQLHGDITVRPTGDLDLLVRRETLPAAAGILRTLGFSEIDRRPGFARAYSNTLEFCKDNGRAFLVEPHWTIAYPPFADRIDMDGVWARCRTGPFLGMDIPLLSNEDVLLHLCLHLIHKRDVAPLLWFYDLHCLIRQQGSALDWPLIALNADRSGHAALLCEVLGNVRSLFATPVPEELFARLTASFSASSQRPSGGRSEQWAERILAGKSPMEVRESLALLFTIKGVRARLRYVLALVFPSPEFMRLRYGLSSSRQLGFRYLARLVSFMWGGLQGVGSLLVPHRMPRPSVK